MVAVLLSVLALQERYRNVFVSPPPALLLLQGFNRMGLLSLIRKLKRREKEIRVLMV